MDHRRRRRADPLDGHRIHRGHRARGHRRHLRDPAAAVRIPPAGRASSRRLRTALPLPRRFPEARILAALFVARLRDGYVFFTDHLSYFAMLDDDAVRAALRTLEADGRITIAKNTSALTEKGRAREFAQLTDTAFAG